MGKCGDTAIRLEAQQEVEPENLILLCVERMGARVMHLSETRGPDDRRPSLQNCSVLGGKIFSITQNVRHNLRICHACVFQALVCWERQFMSTDSDLLCY